MEESHKENLFTDWDIQLKQVEREVSRETDATNNVIETINDNLQNANLIH